MLSDMARTKAALPFDSAQSNMVESCSPLQTMRTAPFSDTQQSMLPLSKLLHSAHKPHLNVLQPDLPKESGPFVLMNQEATVFKEAAQFLLHLSQRSYKPTEKKNL